MGLFSKKKEQNKIVRVLHYEGIDGFASDCPCTLEVKDGVLTLKRIQPETTVTLPLNRIKSFSAMEEKNFMLKYHGQAITTSKSKSINKYYLVVEYDKGMLAFWGTAKEYGRFRDLQYNFNTSQTHIEL